MKNKFIVFLCGIIIACSSVRAMAAESTSGTGGHSGDDNQYGCEQGYYGDGATCTKCPTGFSTPDIGAVLASECSVCDQGYYGDGTTCTKCPTGKSTAGVGMASSASECSVCDRGYQGDGSTCTACPKHKYKNVIGNFSCVYCPAGTYTTRTGASECWPCPRGHCCAYGDAYECRKGTYTTGQETQEMAACATVKEVVQEEQPCLRGGSCVAVPLEDLSIYNKGECKNKCNNGCTTEDTGSVSSMDCTVKTIKTFCIGSGDNNCFSWPIDASISEQSLNNAISAGFSCPGGIQNN